ncbi:hypothetical protein EV198_1427 [Roseivirga ehrenbergii]|uniref:RiboL-PSP-HEPN domain-containing protein n=1 Tax=Roseivirga ehrenbergii (strain DSM 102268 / JCM 13514 / KCTC 12282 / NCIMB 14502 / KMM 6017) TaxID=279360 RepID=A0A150XIR3_ROSEK|nr:hypothetical protein [Roseivirga ehrenbergii]KYG78628.1 hypothetical protein MB14_18025 [Roseivirga ehrenbergii]TCL10397.1 hypothetical protein EV198_1427 [Roseivirga ehrenbergii]
MKKLTIDEVFSTSEIDSKRIIENYKDNINLSSYSSLVELISQGIYLEDTFDLIRTTDRPRIIILETWLVLDELLKRTILKGIGLEVLIYSEIHILPFGFIDKLELLDKIIQSEKNKKPNYSSKSIQIPGSMLTSMLKDKAFFRRYLEYEKEYYTQEELPNSTIDDIENPEKYRFVNETWLDAMQDLPKGWKDMMRKINKARNLASHSIHEDKIYKTFGFNGNDQLETLKQFCLSILSSLTGYKH